MLRIINGKKYYPVSERYMFGLESMTDKCTYWLTCTELNNEEYDKIYALREECYELHSKVSCGWADGKTFGRIKEITVAREEIRFQVNLKAGNKYASYARY